MPSQPPEIVGIVNVTRDSFSDGGHHFACDAAIEHAKRLLDAGADWIDVGAESTHPDAEDVSADEEIERLTPVIRALLALGARVAVDTHKPAVMRHVLNLGVGMINDVTGLGNPEAVRTVADFAARVVVMHSTASRARAERADVDPGSLPDNIRAYFEQRVAGLGDAGIPPDRIILDPGMGFFLSRRADASLKVLRELRSLRIEGCGLYVSTSRKSFLGEVLRNEAGPRPVAEREAATLASELWAAQQGVNYIRTHDVRALRDALVVWGAIEA